MPIFNLGELFCGPGGGALGALNCRFNYNNEEWGSDEWKKRFQKSKYRKNEGFGSWEGPVLLQDHMDRVWYRNLKIKSI